MRNWKKILPILWAVILLAGALVFAPAAEASTTVTVHYVDENGEDGTEEATVITEDMTALGTENVEIKAIFKVEVKGTSLTEPEAGKKQLTVRWKKGNSLVEGYEIQYSLDAEFKDAATVTAGKRKTTETVITGLKKGKTYWVRIRTYRTVDGKQYYSDWSEAMKKKIK